MSIKLNAQSGGSVALDAPTQTTSSADNVYKLPVADGTAGQVLTTDGSGNLAWATDKGKILQVVATNYTGTSTVTVPNAGLADTPATVTITSTAANSKFIISGAISGEGSLADHTIAFVLRRVIGGSGSSINVGGSAGSRSAVSFMQNQGYHQGDQSSTPSTSVMSPYLDSPAQAAGTAITYKIDIIGTGDTGTFYFGRSVSDSNDASHERLPSNITVMELSA